MDENLRGRANSSGLLYGIVMHGQESCSSLHVWITESVLMLYSWEHDRGGMWWVFKCVKFDLTEPRKKSMRRFGDKADCALPSFADLHTNFSQIPDIDPFHITHITSTCLCRTPPPRKKVFLERLWIFEQVCQALQHESPRVGGQKRDFWSINQLTHFFSSIN